MKHGAGQEGELDHGHEGGDGTPVRLEDLEAQWGARWEF